MPEHDKNVKKYWEYVVTSDIGDDPIKGFRENPHQGIDFAVPSGTPITPHTSGTVIATGTSPDWGKYVLIQHDDGTIVRYAHFSNTAKAMVSGARVGETTIIGLVGKTGKATAPHLHVEFQRNRGGEFLDPEKEGILPKLIRSTSIFEGGGGDLPPIAQSGATDQNKLLSALGLIFAGQDIQGSKPLPGDVLGPESSGIFSREPHRGTTREMFEQIPSFASDVGRLEAGRSLPFQNPALGGTGAFAENIIRAMGMIPGKGNPFVDQMEQEVARLALPVLVKRIHSGEGPDQREIADEIMALIKGGKSTPFSEGGLGALFRDLAEPTEQSAEQQLLTKFLLKNPSIMQQLISQSANLPPQLASALPGVLEDRQRKFIRESGSDTEGLLAYLTQGIQ